MKVTIYKNPNGDTRTATKDITLKQFRQANNSHRSDVSNVIAEISRRLTQRGNIHDWTKTYAEDDFYNDFKKTLNGEMNFVDGEWWKYHIEAENHHMTSKNHEDVDLLDVIEMVVDCVCAGLTRSGELRPIEIDDEILRMALNNTVELIKDMVEVE